ncbi:MAG TPA: hypothetical protein VFG76_10090, partial [Candidatus Polarisedimenticolia bacterium]|nr:hypothetical protein [Candidatus Polarisedimenticolia bacterium]
MRKLALCSAVLFVAALAMAQAAETKPAVMTHEVKAEVVSFDVAAKTLTIKDEKGADKTVPVKR